MKKQIRVLIVCILTACMLWGCVPQFGGYGPVDVIHYDDMEYTRPDMLALEQALADAKAAAAGDNLQQILREIHELYDLYDSYYTNYNLADIRYCADLRDSYWEEESNFCARNAATVDAALDSLYRALAKSPCRETLEADAYFGPGYFDSYEDGAGWPAEFLRMLEKEAQLQNEYYDLSQQAQAWEYGSTAYLDACAENMGNLLADLIRVRREIAAYWGYSDYVAFATDFYHYRDYTAEQITAYFAQIRQELVTLYREVGGSDIWENFRYASEAEVYGYVREMARNMGGTVQEAFRLMDQAGLYDIAPGENKYASSFEVYLTTYEEPFIFMNPEGSTYYFLTFAHEFGHFCNDYASRGSYAGVDVLEIFSQGLEYMSLCYVEGTETLAKLKMADSLCVYVEQAAFADFEMAMYALPEEKLNAAGLTELYDFYALAYGFDSVDYDPREYVTITHYYTNPMYIISYVVSNDAAMQLYQMEKESAGAGRKCLEDHWDTEESYFLSFLRSAGLESPFAPGRIQWVRNTFEEVLRSPDA